MPSVRPPRTSVMSDATTRAPQSLTKMAHESLKIRPMSMPTPRVLTSDSHGRSPVRVHQRLAGPQPGVGAAALLARFEQHAQVARQSHSEKLVVVTQQPQLVELVTQARLAREQLAIDPRGEQAGLAFVEGGRLGDLVAQGEVLGTHLLTAQAAHQAVVPGRLDPGGQRLLALVVERQAELAVREKAVLADGAARAGPPAGLTRCAA